MASLSVVRGQLMKAVTGSFARFFFVLINKISNYRVPGIISYPGTIKTGSSSALVSHLDIVPTVLGLLDIQTPLLDNIVLDG